MPVGRMGAHHGPWPHLGLYDRVWGHMLFVGRFWNTHPPSLTLAWRVPANASWLRTGILGVLG